MFGFLFFACAATGGPDTTGDPSNSGSGGDDSDNLDSGASSGSEGGSTTHTSSGVSGSSGGSSSGTTSKKPSSSGADASTGRDASTGSSSGTQNDGTSPSAQYLPKITGTCPTIATGTQTFAGEPVQIWAGTPSTSGNGSLVMFWFETGGSSTDAEFQFGTTQIQAVTAAGGIVASFAATNKMGTNTGDGVWYTGDFTTADQVVACAIDQFHIDTRRIYTMGASAGALQATWMSYVRSGYLAAAATISGGTDFPQALQDTTNVPAALVNHGALGKDVVGIDFAQASAAWEADIAKKGGFSVDCNTGGGHVSGTPQICPAIWQFFEDHPFKVKPQPYPPLPAVFPSDCQIGPREADGGAP
jgi:hypothetical protein